MTRKQELAISRMNRALKALSDADINICGMDCDLLYATKEACESSENFDGDYNQIAMAIKNDTEDSGWFKADCYKDSGGY